MVAVELPADITASFVAEARSYLPHIAASVASIEDKRSLEQAHRFAHTIKSSAAMLGHIGLSQLAELLEADLECFLLGDVPAAGQLAQLDRSAVRLGALLDGVAGEPVDVEAILGEEVEDRLSLDAVAATEEPAAAVQVEMAPEPAAVGEPEIGVGCDDERDDDREPDALDELELVADVPAFGEVPVEADTRIVTVAPVEAEAPLAGEVPLAHEVPLVADVLVVADVPVVAEAPAPVEVVETTRQLPVFAPVVVASNIEELEAAGDTEDVVEAASTEQLTTLIDALAEMVLALGRETANGAPDLFAYRESVAQWLTSFEVATGVAAPDLPNGQDEATEATSTGSRRDAVAETVAVKEPAAAGPQFIELDPEVDGEAALRAALEAELRFEIEQDVRARVTAELGTMSERLDLAGNDAYRAANAPRLLETALAPVTQPVLAATPSPPASAPSARDAHAGAQPVDDLDAELLEVFRLEAAEHLKQIDADVAALRTSAGDVERLRSLRRTVHTLKGAAAMMGVTPVAELSHALEDRLDAFTSGERAVDASTHATLLADLDRLEALITTGVTLDAEPSVERPEVSVPAHEQDVAAEVASASAVAPESDLPSGVAFPAAPAADIFAEASPASLAPAATLHVQVRLDHLDGLLNGAGEAAVAAARWPALLGDAEGALDDLRRATARIQSLHRTLMEERQRALEEAGEEAEPVVSNGHFTGRPASVAADFDPLELDRYTPVDYLAHELSQIAAESAAAERELSSALETAAEYADSQRRLAASQQQQLLATRLVPLEGLRARLDRAAHGVAARRGKEITVTFEDGGVMVDRAVIDPVADALLHLVRNAVDHGIEARAVRRAAGKPEAGTLRVSAIQAQGDVRIDVADDGAGIDVDRVQAAARALGTPAIDYNRGNPLDLIFRHGLTTAGVVDDVSGRGVGLDAVAGAMNRVRGAVHVASEPGRGTVFSLRFPTTLAQTRVVMAEAGGNAVALPAVAVRHVTRLADATLEHSTVTGQPVAALGRDRFPIASLAGTLGLPVAPNRRDAPLMFVEAAGGRAAWIVDRVGSQLDVVVKPFGSHVRPPRGAAGATLLEDGRVALVLHLPDLVAEGSGSHAVSWQSPAPAVPDYRSGSAEPARSLRVLVVDDSPTIRKLLARMLRELGWQPVEARDGAEALERIHVEMPDVVLADVEMPRLDGYGLLAALRQSATTAALPVIMLTSRTADRHRKRAMELGASGYLTKPYRPEDVAAAIRALVTTQAVSSNVAVAQVA